MSPEEKLNKFKLDRRIAHEGYPFSEARFDNLLEYILYLEQKRFEMREEIERLTMMFSHAVKYFNFFHGGENY